MNAQDSLSRLGASLLVAALSLPIGCASAREHLPALPDAPSRPTWLSAPELPSWGAFPLVSRLGFGRGEVRGTIRFGRAEGDADATNRAVVYLEPVAGDRASANEATATIRRNAQRFSPDFLVVAAGQSVVFTNEDAIYHRIFSYSESNAFDTEVLDRGDAGEVRFGEPGEVQFYCALHPDESGSVFVTPSPWFAVAASDGNYRIENVPPGRYRLHTWSDEAPPTTHEVTVRAGDVAAIDVPIRAR